MKLEERIEALNELGMRLEGILNGRTLSEEEEAFAKEIESAWKYNGWFTPENVKESVRALRENLKGEKIREWVGSYIPDPDQEHPSPKKIGLVLAGNLPMVGAHDILSVLVSGHGFMAKVSSKDPRFLPLLMGILTEVEPRFKERISFTNDILKDVDGIIATGSDNTSRYFEHYFGKYPHIIRRNRTGVALLKGDETEEELKALGEDVFRYFGMGCRNVSKLWVPKGWDHRILFNALEEFSWLKDHHKYMNNHGYNRAVFLMNKEYYEDNGFLLLKKDERDHSPLASLFYEEYENEREARQRIEQRKEEVQCIVSREDVPFGRSQRPEPWDYADNIDTLEFLLGL